MKKFIKFSECILFKCHEECDECNYLQVIIRCYKHETSKLEILKIVTFYHHTFNINHMQIFS